MRISELSQASGVPVATIKYYLREGLLHEGERISATQAHYDDTHVARLRLIRALIGVGRLSVASTRDVLGQLDRPRASMHDLLGATHRLLQPPTGDAEVDTARAEKVAAAMGWRLDAVDHSSVRRLAVALAAIEAADFTLPEGEVLAYAHAMQELAEREVAGVPTASTEAAVRHAVLGTVLVEPLLLALRGLAQADASARQFGTSKRRSTR